MIQDSILYSVVEMTVNPRDNGSTYEKYKKKGNKYCNIYYV